MKLEGINVISYEHPEGTVFMMEGCYLNTTDAKHSFMLAVENHMMSQYVPATEPYGC